MKIMFFFKLEICFIYLYILDQWIFWERSCGGYFTCILLNLGTIDVISCSGDGEFSDVMRKIST